LSGIHIEAAPNFKSTYINLKPLVGMKRKSSSPLFLTLAGLILLQIIFATIQSTAQDTKLWNENRVTVKLDKYFDLLTGLGLRWEDDITQFHQVSVLAGFNWSPAPSFTLTPTYLYMVTYPLNRGPNRTENLFSLLPTFRVQIKSTELSLSNGIEYRDLSHTQNSWRFRPRFKLSHPLGPQNFRLSAYITEELFYDTGPGTWTRNRFFVGTEKRLITNLAVELYYCRQSELYSSAPDGNIIGINLRMSFGPKTLPPPAEPDFE
jgi:hypothetical protein